MKVINFFIFQASWFITVFSAAAGYPYTGIIFTCLWMFYHLSTIKNEQRGGEILLLLSAAVLGFLLDSALLLAGYIIFPEQAQLGVLSPAWMVALWVNLAATINFSLAWLKSRLILSGLLAAIAGPFAYSAGEKLGAIIVTSDSSLIAISVVWLLAMPLMIIISGFVYRTSSFSIQNLINKKTEQM